jgi:Spy/CpxP family protein refolding chaperone
MKKTLLAVIAAGLMVAPGVFAQSQAEPSSASARHEHHRGDMTMRVQRHVNHLATVLSLSPDQKQKATEIFTNAAKENSPVFADLRTERKSLKMAVEKNESADAIKQFSDKIGTDVAQMAMNEASAGKQFYQVLSPEQQSKLAQLHSERRGGRHANRWGM